MPCWACLAWCLMFAVVQFRNTVSGWTMNVHRLTANTYILCMICPYIFYLKLWSRFSSLCIISICTYYSKGTKISAYESSKAALSHCFKLPKFLYYPFLFIYIASLLIDSCTFSDLRLEYYMKKLGTWNFTPGKSGNKKNKP